MKCLPVVALLASLAACTRLLGRVMSKLPLLTLAAIAMCVGLLVLAACKGAPAPAEGDAARPTASSVTSVEAASAALDDLLHFTEARIGVSSKVDNPRDFAEHVADGRLDTAWNGKTGDL